MPWCDQQELISPNVLLCNTAKGLYLKDRKLQSEACRDALGRDQPYAILSGIAGYLKVHLSPGNVKLFTLRAFLCERDYAKYANRSSGGKQTPIPRGAYPADDVYDILQVLQSNPRIWSCNEC